MKIEELPIRQVRYWCFRFKTEEAGGNKAEGAPKGLRKHFEGQEDFTGWDQFNESKGWDVKKDSPLEMKPLRFGSDELWDRELNRTARPLPDNEAEVVMNSNKKAKKKPKKK